MVSYGIVWYSTHSQTSKQAPNIRSLYILPLHLQASKQESSNRKSLEPPPHTHIEFLQYMEYRIWNIEYRLQYNTDHWLRAWQSLQALSSGLDCWLGLELGLQDSGGLAGRRRPRPGYSNSSMAGGYFPSGGLKVRKH